MNDTDRNLSADNETVAAPSAPVFDRPPLAPPPVREKRFTRVGLLLITAVALALLALVVFSALSIFRTGKYTFNDHSIAAYHNAEGRTVFLFNGEKTVTVDGRAASPMKTDIHHTAVAYLDEAGALRVVTRKGATTAAENVSFFLMDANGNKVAYLTEVFGDNGRLCLYDIDSKKSTQIDTNVRAAEDSFLLSPTGKSLSYIKNYENGGSYDTYLSKNGHPGVLFGKSRYVVALSDSTEYLYYINENNKFCVERNGTATELASSGEITFFLWNKDAKELLLSLSDGKSYLVRRGGAPELLYEGSLRGVVMPQNAVDGAAAYHLCTVGSFVGHVLWGENASGAPEYFTFDSRLSRLHIIGAAENVMLSGDGKQLFSLNGGSLSMIPVRTPAKAVTLSVAVREYIINEDGFDVYCIKEDGSVWYVRGDKNVKVASDCGEYVMSRDGTFFFTGAMGDDDTLYSSRGGSDADTVKHGRHIALLNDANGCVTFVSADEEDAGTLYYTPGGTGAQKMTANISY